MIVLEEKKGTYSFSDVYDMNNLYTALKKCSRESKWKKSVQDYQINFLRNISRANTELRDGTYKHLPFNEFTMCERGKTREIKAVNIYDRVILSSLCENVLIPYFRKYFIYDNGASLTGKGVKFTRDRLETHLHKYYRANGTNEGYILLIDFTKYFDNIGHEKLMQEFRSRMDDKEIMDFVENLVDFFKIDVSYMSDEEYATCEKDVFNAIEYANIDKSLLTGEKYMRKSVGIGSQLSQIAGLIFPSRVDNYCKIVKGVKYYGRYMDDIYIIHQDKYYLKQLLKEVKEICDEYGIHINEKKTQITKISKTFSFLKTRYYLTETGKVVKRMNKDSIARERRKLKSYRRLMDKGEMPYKDILDSYSSWRGNLKHYKAFHTSQNMDKLFNELFYDQNNKGDKSNERIRKKY